MPERVEIHSRRVRVPIGDIKHVVELCRAASVPRAGGKTEKALTVVKRAYMAIDTLGGRTAGGGQATTNGRNVRPAATHKFTARYRPEFTAELVLRHAGRLYEILDLEQIDGQQKYTAMRCRLMGDVDREAAEA